MSVRLKICGLTNAEAKAVEFDEACPFCKMEADEAADAAEALVAAGEFDGTLEHVPGETEAYYDVLDKRRVTVVGELWIVAECLRLAVPGRQAGDLKHRPVRDTRR